MEQAKLDEIHENVFKPEKLLSKYHDKGAIAAIHRQDCQDLLVEIERLTSENSELVQYKRSCERLEHENAEYKKALEIALGPVVMSTCPSKNLKKAVKCRDGWEQDKNICLQCWTDFVIQQAKEALNK